MHEPTPTPTPEPDLDPKPLTLPYPYPDPDPDPNPNSLRTCDKAGWIFERVLTSPGALFRSKRSCTSSLCICLPMKAACVLNCSGIVNESASAGPPKLALFVVADRDGRREAAGAISFSSSSTSTTRVDWRCVARVSDED